MRLGSTAFVGFVAVVLASCKPPATGPRPDNLGDVGAALDRAERVAAGPVNATGKAMAFVVTAQAGGRGGEIIGFDLEGRRELWRTAAEVAGRVVVGGPVVLHTDRQGTLIARNVRTGAIAWSKPLDANFERMGYASDGDGVYEVIASAGGHPREGQLIGYDAPNGNRRFSLEMAGPVAGPAARGGVVAVPRQSQYVTLVDGHKGKKLADILSREQEASYVRGLPEGFAFGSRGVFLASEKTAFGDKSSGHYLEAKTPAFVRPLYHYDHYKPAQLEHSALDRNRLLWRLVVDGDRAGFKSGLVVVHNFRFFFGIDPASGDVRWAFNHPRVDAMASEHTGSTVIFVTAEGTLGALDARSGRRVYEAALGSQPVAVLGATFDADGFAPSGGEGTTPDLVTSLASMLWDADTRFSDVRLFAVDELVKRPGREATQALLRALDAGEQIPDVVLKKATDALIARQDRSMLDLYIQALKVHPDYAEDRKPKRLDFFARAVAEMKAKEAVPALVEHLRLPDTDMDVVPAVADAVLTLKATDAVEAFQDFLMQYRADSSFSRQIAALTSAADVLYKLGGPTERSTLTFVANDPQTLEMLAGHVRKLLAE